MCGALSEKGEAAEELAFAQSLLDRVVAGLPRARLALHVCRGNWTRDERAALAGDYRPLLPLLAEVPVGTLFLELATPRAGEMDVLAGLPSDVRIGVGVVNQKQERVEPVEEIAGPGPPRRRALRRRARAAHPRLRLRHLRRHPDRLRHGRRGQAPRAGRGRRARAPRLALRRST